jgi:hypothetical protein
LPSCQRPPLRSHTGRAPAALGMDSSACIPADQGPYYLSVKGKGAVSIFKTGDSNLVLNVAPGEGLTGEGVGSREGLTLDKRVHLLSDAGLLISIPATNDRLVLRRLKLGRGR